jgi:homoserine dehydrogenase
VLKFGGSVLRGEADLQRGVHEAYRWLRECGRVVVVVSALEGTTDRLLGQARGYTEEPRDEASRALVATGELTTASLLTLALKKAGLDARLLTPHQIDLRTSGEAADAAPVSVQRGLIEAALEETPVVVVPGFIGIDERGAWTLLGRGGSDLTALFLAAELGAARCRLIKDVDGLYERDPALPGPRVRRFAACSWDDALKLDGGIVQHKAVRLARERGLRFEVGTWARGDATVVGARPSRFDLETPRSTQHRAHSTTSRQPLRVVLLGAGTVGGGVHELLRRSPQFEVCRVAVRDVERAVRRGLQRESLTDNAVSAAREQCDVVIELMGGIDPAGRCIRDTLAQGKHVITANKRLVAESGPELETLARACGGSLRYSAAVGGGAPMLETLRRITARERVVALEGVINGTSNFILDRVLGGASFADALTEAQRLGLAEADPRSDLHGLDAAQKLAILARQAFGVDASPEEFEREVISADVLAELRGQCPPGFVIRQVSSARLAAGRVLGSVRLRIVPESGALGSCRSAANVLLIRTGSDRVHRIGGTGAGRWPTAESIFADLLDLARELRAPSRAEPLPVSPCRTRRRAQTGDRPVRAERVAL